MPDKLTIDNKSGELTFDLYENLNKINIEINLFSFGADIFITKDQAEKLIHWLQLAVKELA